MQWGAKNTLKPSFPVKPLDSERTSTELVALLLIKELETSETLFPEEIIGHLTVTEQVLATRVGQLANHLGVLKREGWKFSHDMTEMLEKLEKLIPKTLEPSLVRVLDS